MGIEPESEPETSSEPEPESEPYPESENREPKAAAQPVTKLRSNSAASSVWSYPGIEPNCSHWSCFTVIVGRWNLCGVVGYEAAQCLIYQNQTRKLYLTVNMQSYLTTFLCKCTLDLVSIN